MPSSVELLGAVAQVGLAGGWTGAAAAASIPPLGPELGLSHSQGLTRSQSLISPRSMGTLWGAGKYSTLAHKGRKFSHAAEPWLHHRGWQQQPQQ